MGIWTREVQCMPAPAIPPLQVNEFRNRAIELLRMEGSTGVPIMGLQVSS